MSEERYETKREPECQGICKEHRGSIKRVEVRDIRNRKDWGLFSYCDEAIEEDIKRGLDVSIVEIAKERS